MGRVFSCRRYYRASPEVNPHTCSKTPSPEKGFHISIRNAPGDTKVTRPTSTFTECERRAEEEGRRKREDEGPWGRRSRGSAGRAGGGISQAEGPAGPGPARRPDRPRSPGQKRVPGRRFWAHRDRRIRGQRTPDKGSRQIRRRAIGNRKLEIGSSGPRSASDC